jgi:hypothetical protein
LFFRNLYLQGVLRDQQFSEQVLGSESFPLNPHSTGHAAKTSATVEPVNDSEAEH